MTYKKNEELLKKTFSALLKSNIAESGYTLKEAAEKFKISDREVSHLANGESLPEFITLINIALEFNIDLNQYLITIREKGYTPIDKEKIKA